MKFRRVRTRDALPRKSRKRTNSSPPKSTPLSPLTTTLASSWGQILSQYSTDTNSSRWHLYGTWPKKPFICPWVAFRAASERIGIILECFKDFYLEAKAGIWPWLSYVCQIRSRAVYQWAITLSHTRYCLDGFRESTPPHNCLLVVLISNRKQWVDEFLGELTF
jgi:hypothetical protein